MSNDSALCAGLNAELGDEWEPFEPLGDGLNVQAYLKEGGYGIIGWPRHWRVVFAADGVPVRSFVQDTVEAAMEDAEDLAGREAAETGREAAERRGER